MTNQYFWDRIAGRDGNIRAADADRERAAELLRKGHAEGRLDMTEFQERLERCYEAKTFGDLDEIVRDLPRQHSQVERRPSASFLPWRRPLTAAIAILIALVVISSASAHHHVAWLWIPLVFLIWRMSWWRRGRSWAGGRRGSNDWI